MAAMEADKSKDQPARQDQIQKQKDLLHETEVQMFLSIIPTCDKPNDL